jgi:hypothetical protein
MTRSLKSIIAIIVLLSALFLLCGLADQGEQQAAAQESSAYAPYLNPDLPIEKRVADLIPRLTLKEKISLIYWLAPAIPRLGIEVRARERCHPWGGRPWDRDGVSPGHRPCRVVRSRRGVPNGRGLVR